MLSLREQDQVRQLGGQSQRLQKTGFEKEQNIFPIGVGGGGLLGDNFAGDSFAKISTPLKSPKPKVRYAQMTAIKHTKHAQKRSGVCERGTPNGPPLQHHCPRGGQRRQRLHIQSFPDP